MKYTISILLLVLAATCCFAQSNELRLFVNSSTAGQIDNYATIGAAYYRKIAPHIKLGMAVDMPLKQNTFRHRMSSYINGIQLDYEYVDKINLFNLDLLSNVSVLNKKHFQVNFYIGAAYQRFYYTYVPLLEVKDNVITNNTERKGVKGFVLPKCGISTSLKITKGIGLYSMLYYRTASLYSNNEIYTSKGIHTSSTNHYSGSGSSTMRIFDQAGFNIGLSYEF
jgi:hypothetical protein